MCFVGLLLHNMHVFFELISILYGYAHKNRYMDVDNNKDEILLHHQNHHGWNTNVCNKDVWKVLAHKIACVIYQIDSLRQHVYYLPNKEKNTLTHTHEPNCHKLLY